MKDSRQMLQASSVSSSSKAEDEEEEAMAGLKGGDFSDKLKAEAYVKLDIVCCCELVDEEDGEAVD